MTTKRFWSLTIIFAILALILILFLPGYSRFNELREQEEKFSSEVRRLERENAQLRQDKSLLERDVTRLEEAMRTELGKVKPDEVVYRVVPAKAEPAKKKE